jgi:hypothetical protein
MSMRKDYRPLCRISEFIPINDELEKKTRVINAKIIREMIDPACRLSHFQTKSYLSKSAKDLKAFFKEKDDLDVNTFLNYYKLNNK